MSYFNKFIETMGYVSKNKKTIFLGQSVSIPGTVMYNTLEKVPFSKRKELPVAEEMQMGMTLGLALNGYIPISLYPRWNFLLLAINQLVNHIDKIKLMSSNGFDPRMIIRTSVGSINPLDPHYQHKGDFTTQVKNMCPNIKFYYLYKESQIMKSYKEALLSKRNKISVIVEVADNFNN